MPDLEKTAPDKLHLEWSTFKFICLCIVTLSVFYYFWVWKLINKVSDAYARPSNRVIAIFYFAFSIWGSVFTSYNDNDLSALGGIFQLLAVILVIVLSFRIRPALEKYLASRGTPLKLAGIWCFIFPFYYQYYVSYNAAYLSKKEKEATTPPAAPQSNVVDKLKELNELKKSGAITEEQFEAAKKKLLGS